VKERLPAHGAVFLVHGEDEERQALRQNLMRDDGLGGDQVILPLLDDTVELRSEGLAAVAHPAQPRADLGQLATDWHNAYAAFIIDLTGQLGAAENDPKRMDILKSLQTALTTSASRPAPSPTRPEPPGVLHGEPGGE
jgi:metallo-beta-lactamase family protein